MRTEMMRAILVAGLTPISFGPGEGARDELRLAQPPGKVQDPAINRPVRIQRYTYQDFAPPPPPAVDNRQVILADPTLIQNADALNRDFPIALRGRALGGDIEEGRDHPECVAVRGLSEGVPRDNWIGTGTLISPDVVITAGHLYADGVPNGGITAIFIGQDVAQSAAGETVPVRVAVRHGGYRHNQSPPSLENDLTLLILERRVDAGLVRPRRIASTADIDRAPYLRFVGYGTTDRFGLSGYGVRRGIKVPVIFNGHDPTKEALYGCTGGRELVAIGKGDTCDGDSGGPGYVFCGGQWLLATVTSRPTLLNRIFRCGDGGIYVRLDRYEDWIRDTAVANGGVWP